jgi:hypothetical protein
MVAPTGKQLPEATKAIAVQSSARGFGTLVETGFVICKLLIPLARESRVLRTPLFSRHICERD